MKLGYCLATLGAAMASHAPSTIRIKENALRDNIDLTVLPFIEDALKDISSLHTQRDESQLPFFNNATRIDTHTHAVPSWFRSLQPLAAGRETPSWDPISHLKFMNDHHIAHSILCVSTPQANAFPDNREKTVALARLLNEYVSELVRVFPERFSWLAVTPLPYVKDAVVEVRYAVEELGAIGVGVLTNHEGLYPGETSFDPLWEYLQNRAESGDGKEIVFIHPHDPVIRLDNGSLVSSKPCKCSQRSPSDFNLTNFSTPPIWSRGVLFRNRSSNIQHHGKSDNHKISKPPLASVTRSRSIPRYLRPILTWLP